MALKQLRVIYQGWGECWPLGTLADDGRHLLFEYSPEALRQGLELSPLRLKLRPQAYGGFAEHQFMTSPSATAPVGSTTPMCAGMGKASPAPTCYAWPKRVA